MQFFTIRNVSYLIILLTMVGLLIIIVTDSVTHYPIPDYVTTTFQQVLLAAIGVAFLDKGIGLVNGNTLQQVQNKLDAIHQQVADTQQKVVENGKTPDTSNT